MPGAGDDEESWARGLTPSLLHKHQEVKAAWPDSMLVHLRWPQGCGVGPTLLWTGQAILASMLPVSASMLPSKSVQHTVHEGLTCGCDAQELMAAGPDAVHAAVEHILAEAQAVGNAAGSSVPMTHGAAGDAEGSLHNLAPLGARVAADAATVHRTGTPPDQSMSLYRIRLCRVWCMFAGPFIISKDSP